MVGLLVLYEHIILIHSIDKVHSPVYSMILNLTVLTNSLAFFGKELANNEPFMVSALAYIEDTFKCAEVLRLLPSLMVP